MPKLVERLLFASVTLFAWVMIAVSAAIVADAEHVEVAHTFFQRVFHDAHSVPFLHLPMRISLRDLGAM